MVYRCAVVIVLAIALASCTSLRDRRSKPAAASAAAPAQPAPAPAPARSRASTPSQTTTLLKPQDYRAGGPVPPMEGGRAINEQDCTQGINLTAGNLRCK